MKKETPINHITSLLLKTFGIMLAFSAVLAVSAAVLAADSYPSKTVRIIVPTAPGGGADSVGRLIAAKLTQRLGRQVIVENHGGGGGIIGTEMAAKADPDGYTLIIVNGTNTIQPALQKLPYDLLKSFIPIAHLASGPQVLAVHPSVPANSVKELIAFAKQKPGQLIFASSGSGSTAHMAIELFKMMADIDFKIVQFKSGGPALVDAVGGHSHAFIGSIAGAIPHIKSGKLRVLGTGGVKRSVILPDVSTIAESGIPGFRATGWYGIQAPAGTPAPIIDRLNKDIKAILVLDEVRRLLLKAGVEVDYIGLTEFGTFLLEEVTRWANVVKKANIKLEK